LNAAAANESYHFEPRTKGQGMEWVHVASPEEEEGEARTIPSPKKL
jgi:hypothetical protein